MQATVKGIRIAGMQAAVPTPRHSFVETPEHMTPEEAQKLYGSIGVHSRRIAPPQLLASDLCVAAAESLLDDLGWSRDSIEVLVLVTQGPDYLLPATACLIQKRLGLPTSCAAFDVNLGCSGFVYGSWIASQLLSGSQGKRALLLCGDVSTRLLHPDDRATRPLFGDAGTATALEKVPDAAPMHIVLGTDGGGGRHISIKSGGLRHNLVEALRRPPEENETLYKDAHTHLNGPEVFSFTLRAVPALMREVLDYSGLTIDQIDTFVMHQANKFILEHLRKKTGIPAEKFVIDMHDFGNTSSASIPLAICHKLASAVAETTQRAALVGFGVGWSWGALIADLGPIPRPRVIDVPDDFATLAL
ncbi:MAG: ketoacyl-ACP synthase III [Aliidongia sp.]